jgi:CubicO group peptidase (beta-lactamase class C family)
MTSTLAAMLIERGALKWDTTLADVFPNLQMDAAWRGVTLEQLLSHRAGAPHDPPPDLWVVAQMRAGTPTEQRWEFVRGLLQTPPDPPAGTKFIYSNQGYSIAGVMLEQATGKPWEELMRDMLFRPLKLDSAGFGAPGSPRDVDQPWGHLRAASRLGPITPGPFADNPPVIGPAGTVHAGIGDFARYAGWHADEARRDDSRLKAASFRKLHTALEGQDYAPGWRVVQRPWAGGRVLTHNGTNTMNYAVMWVAPERDFAVVAATNAGGPDAGKGCDDAVAMLVRRWEASQ